MEAYHRQLRKITKGDRDERAPLALANLEGCRVRVATRRRGITETQVSRAPRPDDSTCVSTHMKILPEGDRLTP